MKLGDLLVKIGADASEYFKGLKQAEDKTNSFASSLKKIGGAIAGVFAVGKIIEFGKELSNIRKEASGIESAFNRVADAGSLERLRKATNNTVSDLELMRSTVQASNLGLSVGSLAPLFEFASKRAQDTGQSVAYLVESIVTGIGRKSPLILDNLGISAVNLQQKLGSLSMGAASVEQIGEAVSKIATEELAKSGGLVTDYGASVQQLTVAWDNFKLALSGGLENTETVSIASSLADIVRNLTKFVSENTPAIVGWAKVLGVVVGVLGTARLAMIAFNIAMMANPIGLIITIVATLVTGIITAYKSFDKFRAVIDHVWKSYKYYDTLFTLFFKELFAKLDVMIFGAIRNYIAIFKGLWDAVLGLVKGKNPIDTFSESWKKNSVDIKGEVKKISDSYDKLRANLEKPVMAKVEIKSTKNGSTTTSTTPGTITSTGGTPAEKIVRDASISAIKQGGFGVGATADILDTSALKESIANNFEEVKAEYLRQQEELQQFIDQMNSLVSQGVADMVTTFAEGFGELLSGNIGIEEFANKILGQLGDFLKQIGSALIAYGIGMEAFKKAFTNPALAIGAGVALVALGSYISSKASAGPSASTSASGYSSSGYSSSNASTALAGNVTFEIQGNRLVGVLNNENKANRYIG